MIIPHFLSIKKFKKELLIDLKNLKKSFKGFFNADYLISHWLSILFFIFCLNFLPHLVILAILLKIYAILFKYFFLFLDIIFLDMFSIRGISQGYLYIKKVVTFLFYDIIFIYFPKYFRNFFSFRFWLEFWLNLLTKVILGSIDLVLWIGKSSFTLFAFTIPIYLTKKKTNFFLKYQIYVQYKNKFKDLFFEISVEAMFTVKAVFFYYNNYGLVPLVKAVQKKINWFFLKKSYKRQFKRILLDFKKNFNMFKLTLIYSVYFYILEWRHIFLLFSLIINLWLFFLLKMIHFIICFFRFCKIFFCKFFKLSINFLRKRF